MHVIQASPDRRFVHYAALLSRWQQSRSSAAVAFSAHCLPQQSVPLQNRPKMQLISKRVALLSALRTCLRFFFFFSSSSSDSVSKAFTLGGRLNWSDVILCPFCISDDGKLSFEEFNTYFADGILTTEELQELFYAIDGRQNRWPFFIWTTAKLMSRLFFQQRLW